jgi:outer membrane biosynthesis protein TonB
MVRSVLVGHAACPECGQRSEVRENKRKKLLLDCVDCSTFLYQSLSAQTKLRSRTTFLNSEKPPESVASPEPEPVEPKAPEPEPAPAPKEPEPAPEPKPEKSKKWSFFK